VHDEDTFRNLKDSLNTYKRLLHSQTEYIRQLEHERDLLAAGYRAARSRCAELEAAAAAQFMSE
jgi:hypothetical protein